jgi:predicted NBD/HSP70 family sugar kinase
VELPSGERASFNFYRVLRSIWRSNGVSRTDLAALHKLDKTTISQIVSELAAQGLVRVLDIDTATGKPGRRSELLTVDPRWGVVVGIEIRPDGINACATDMHANIVATHHHRQVVERSNLKDAFLQSLESIKADDRVYGQPVVGVGCAVSGLVNRAARTIHRSIPLDIHDPYDFGVQVSSQIHVPVIVDNDANACAWGQLVHGPDDSPENFLFVLIEFRTAPQRQMYGGDIGLGLGFVIGDTVYYGANGTAGEFRSIFWHPGYRNQFSIPDNEAHDILDRPDVLPRLVDEMASNIALLANSLDLGAVYIGGDVGPIKDLLLGSFESAIRNNWPYDDPVPCRVELSSLEGDIVSSGAAAMVLEHIFAEPALAAGLRIRNSIWRNILSARTAAAGLALEGVTDGRTYE